MASPRRTKKIGFLTNYKVDEPYLIKPDRALGKAGMWQARDSDSNDVLIKYWPRKRGVDDADLEDIWRSEIRQLQRLAAVPRADDLFVHMLRSGKDEEGFYLVLNPGLGAPLGKFLAADKKPALLTQARTPRYRRILWANARRLAEALELLHSQGAIHRNLDPWAVVTALTDDPDFRITGFEWSMRIATVDASSSKRMRTAPRAENYFSFARDWRDLAHLFASFLDIPSGPLGDHNVIPSRVADHASAAEIRLLRTMLGLETVERLDGEYVCKKIDEILDSITAEAAGRDARLCLATRLVNNSRLSEAIRLASGNEIEISNTEEQIRFIVDDLGTQPLLVALQENPDHPIRYALLGNLLTYRLQPWQLPGATDAGWEFASCDRADSEAPNGRAIVGKSLIDTGSLEIVDHREAVQSFPRRRGRVQRWDDYQKRAAPEASRKTELDRMHRSFALMLVLEMAYAAADIFPVEIVSKEPDDKTESHTICVVSRNDEDRAKLSQLLGLDAPATRLSNLLTVADDREEGAWTLSEPGMLGERSSTATNWRYVGREDRDNLECHKFEGAAATEQRVSGFLAPTGMVGRIAQFKRRVKALTALNEHAELLRMLADPRLRIDESQDPLDELDDGFKELDSSKQSALREIFSTIPLFLLQGPPGVGKTYLVGDVVSRRFADEATSRILLTAQSNSAIDHLMNEVQSNFANIDPSDRPLMVRARAADDDDSAGELEIDVQAAKLLDQLAKSDLVSKASSHIGERIYALAESRASSGTKIKSKAGHPRLGAELRAFEGMILRAANLVFATTNSAAVERLIEERGLFDWTIIEEAGKATGGELLSPLLLSHRRLMIGDHKQLPPFDLDKITKLLASTEKVKEAVTLVDDLISRYLRDSGTDGVFHEVEANTDELGRACADTLAIVSLFETFLERELTRQKTKGIGRPIARRLEEQYRMHPAIARIVSHCFYEDALKTNPKVEKKYLESAPLIVSKNTNCLPDTPIVFIDMPYGREEAPGGKSGDRRPPWHNVDEVNAAIRALSLLRPRDKTERPSLAVLSPYQEQVKALRKAIGKHTEGTLSHLAQFTAAVEPTEFCGTVDSFQGGEADVVVISLVRNNTHSTPAKALGFLRDNRRMNVLLSRAKWRVVLIGSLSFYENIVSLSAKVPDQDIGFLRKFLDALKAEVGRKQATIIPWSKLKGHGP